MKEHEIVFTTKDIKATFGLKKAKLIPKGTSGTIVYVYPDSAGFEVEFKGGIVETIKADDLEQPELRGTPVKPLKLSDFLKNVGIKSKEVRQRISQGSIKINNEQVKEDIQLNATFCLDAGDFICAHLDTNVGRAFKLQGKDVFGSNLCDGYFDDFCLVSVSKKQHYVIF